MLIRLQRTASLWEFTMFPDPVAVDWSVVVICIGVPGVGTVTFPSACGFATGVYAITPIVLYITLSSIHKYLRDSTGTVRNVANEDSWRRPVLFWLRPDPAHEKGCPGFALFDPGPELPVGLN